MSNPLFASHIMQMAYLCKPGKPDKLLLCFPFASNFADVSKYGATTTYSGNSFGNANYSGYRATALMILSAGMGTISSKEMDFGEDWSFDFVCYCHLNGYINIVLGPIEIKLFDGLYFDGTKLGTISGRNIDSGGVRTGHLGFKYKASDSTLRWYIDGSLQATYTITKPTTTATTISITSSIAYEGAGIANVRFIQKYIGSDGTYPVQNTPYTGYETL